METIWNYGIALVIVLQNLGTWLLQPMKALSFLGTQEFFLIVLPAVYWCYDAQAGLRAGIALMLSIDINAFFKLSLMHPRPYWYSAQVQAYWPETSFGLPSGHAMNAVSLFGSLAQSIRKNWAYWTAGALAVLIGISRIYLGSHFPTDVLGGWLLGLLLLAAINVAEKPVSDWLRGRPLWQPVLAMLALSLLLIAAPAGVNAVTGPWSMPTAWQENIIRTAGVLPLESPLSLEGAVTAAGALFGLVLGALWMGQNGTFTGQARNWRVFALRYGAGLIILLALYIGSGLLQPDQENLLSFVIRYIRYTLIGVWISAGAPLLFRRLKIS